MLSTLRSFILLHRTYRTLPAGARLHTLIRFLTCPFTRVVKHVPKGARSMLEIGAGHGVFSRLVANRGVSRVVAVEPDLRKVVVARHVDGVFFVAGFDDVVGGTFDCVAIIDVLYTIPVEQWDALLERAARRLPAGGTLLVKEQDPEARLKNLWNRTQEWITQKILRLTLAKAFSYESTARFTERLESHGFGPVAARKVDFGYPHPHLLYVATKR